MSGAITAIDVALAAMGHWRFPYPVAFDAPLAVPLPDGTFAIVRLHVVSNAIADGVYVMADSRAPGGSFVLVGPSAAAEAMSRNLADAYRPKAGQS